MPRKSAASTTTTDPPPANGDVSMLSETPQEPADTATTTTTDKPESKGKRKSEGDITIDDLLLPRTITARICKGVLPPNTSIHRDAILALTKSATVFISMLASEANEQTERKTIQSQDVIKALWEVEMGEVMGLGRHTNKSRVEREVEKWEGDVRGKRRGYREKVAARNSGTGVGDMTVGEGDTTMGTEGGDETEKVPENTTSKEGNGDNRVSGNGATDEDVEDRYKRARLDEVGDEGSTGPITNGTRQLDVERQDDAGDEDVDDDEDEDQDAEDDLEEEEQEESQEVEDTMEMDDADKERRKNGPLAPNGRIEVGLSDDDDSD